MAHFAFQLKYATTENYIPTKSSKYFSNLATFPPSHDQRRREITQHMGLYDSFTVSYIEAIER